MAKGAKNKPNEFNEVALTKSEYDKYKQTEDKFNQILKEGESYFTPEQLKKPIINKPYRFLDNLAPFIEVAIIYPVSREKSDGSYTWERTKLDRNVINIKELILDGAGRAEGKIVCYDPDYVFLEELALRIESFNIRGVPVKLEIEFGWAVDNSLKLQYPQINFTEILHISNLRVAFIETKNGLTAEIKGGIDQLLVDIGKNIKPSVSFGIGSVGNYFTIYDFICIDVEDKLEMVWDNLKDSSQKKEFISSYIEYINATSSGSASLSAKALNELDRAIKTDKYKNIKNNIRQLKAELIKIERAAKLPSTPYDVLKFLRSQDTKGKIAVNLNDKFLSKIDIIMQNYRIHPYRVYKFLVDVFQNDVLKNDELKKIEDSRFIDIDFVNLSRMGGNIPLSGEAKYLIKKTGKSGYLEAINMFYQKNYGEVGKDYRALVRDVYKSSKSKVKKFQEEFNKYFFPVKDYSLNTQTDYEGLITSVASKIKSKDNVVFVAGKQKDDDTSYVCQLFRATPFSALQNLRVLNLIVTQEIVKLSPLIKKDILEKINNLTVEARRLMEQQQLTGEQAKFESGVIFSILGPNQLTAIVSDKNAYTNFILTSYSYRMRTLKNENYFNSGSQDFIRNNLPDVLALEAVYGQDKDNAVASSAFTPSLINGSNYKFFTDIKEAGFDISDIISKARKLKTLKGEIEKLKEEFNYTGNKKELVGGSPKGSIKKDGTISKSNVANRLKLSQEEFNNLLYGFGLSSESLINKIREGLFKAILDDVNKRKIVENLPTSSAIKKLPTSLSEANSINDKIEAKKKELSKNKKAKTDFNESEERYNLAQGDYGLIEQFLDEYDKATGFSNLFPAKFNLNFNDPVLFGAGSSPTAEGIASNKEMERFRRIRALESNNQEVTLTVLGNPELKIWYGKGAGAPIFLQVFNPDGTVSDLTGEYAVGSLAYKFTTGIFTNELKLRKQPTKNSRVLDYLQNNDILSIC